MNVPFDLTEYCVAVGGGSRGIGREITLAFLAAGAKVSVCGRRKASLEALHDTTGSHAARLYTRTCDLACPDQIQNWVDQSAQAMGGLDVLVNNATGFGFGENDDDWLKDFNIDLLAAVRASRHALPYLKRSPHPSILSISSIASLRASKTMPSYAAIKAAVNNYTMTQAFKLAKDRIRVNAIAPGSIEFKGGVWDRDRRENREVYAEERAEIPFERFGRPEEVAYLALFLASHYASWITGQIIAVDGGQGLRS